MEIVLPEIVSAGIFNVQSDKTSKKRTTVMFELELVTENGGISYINKETAKLEPSLIICVKPGVQRKTRFPFRCRYIHFILKNGELYERLMELPDFIKINKPGKYEEVFSKIQEYFESPAKEDEIIMHSMVMKLIYMLLKDSQGMKKLDRIRSNNYIVIENAIKFINDNLTEDLSLNKVAAYAGMSPIHFHNCFKTATSYTLRRYVEELRIKKAANMLVTTDFTLTKIAYECGFGSQAYFSYAFKRKMKLTPGQYVKSFFENYGS